MFVSLYFRQRDILFIEKSWTIYKDLNFKMYIFSVLSLETDSLCLNGPLFILTLKVCNASFHNIIFLHLLVVKVESRSHFLVLQNWVKSMVLGIFSICKHLINHRNNTACVLWIQCRQVLFKCCFRVLETKKQFKFG